MNESTFKIERTYFLQISYFLWLDGVDTVMHKNAIKLNKNSKTTKKKPTCLEHMPKVKLNYKGSWISNDGIYYLFIFIMMYYIHNGFKVIYTIVKIKINLAKYSGLYINNILEAVLTLFTLRRLINNKRN